MAAERREDPELFERVARLEADVRWLKRAVERNSLVQMATFILIIILLAKMVLGG